jgi:hypothetical protein
MLLTGRMVGPEGTKLEVVVVGRKTGVLVGAVVPLGDFDVLGDTDGVALGKLEPGWRLTLGRMLGTWVLGETLRLGTLVGPFVGSFVGR